MITLVLKETLPKHNPALDHIFGLQKHCCLYCGQKIEGKDKTKDHLFPQSLGFQITGNLVFSCLKCNQRKANRLPTFEEVLKAFYMVYSNFPSRFIGKVRHGKPVIRIN